ncbi:MAG: Fe-S cluster assembly protein NifU [Desulfarculaceae bacterium]|nr:Fe-S cluster assembly protein NifU [Desulfarculaceae bacterium]MCF8070879.1 Fe-S cluster assembly protein NifU [Desulfarculaceae bacterium]MCF8100467.1 Fe-S cluster assembly protein NifU [Desulfarculaceae bacterium]MCF8117947.1 Fe-S cluster assembly protein NifU [Desulfarculaceae bacterium]
MWEYTDKVKKYFTEPVNVGEVENPDGVGEVGSLACGDALKLTFKLGEDGKIADAKFQTFGCASAIASSSALTELVKGMTLEEAEKLTNKDIADFLGGLPKEKMHCSVMGEEALQAAIRNYRGLEPLPQAEGEVVCQCFGVTDQEIEKVARTNDLHSVEEITNYTKAGGGCGECVDKIQAILDRVWETTPKPVEVTPPAAKKKPLTNIQKMKLIEETLEREVRPALKADGGDIELIDIDGDNVLVSLRGRCSSCAASAATLGQFVQSKLREFVSDDLKVQEVKP